MSRSDRHEKMTGGPEGAGMHSSSGASLRNTIQCRQCSEMFPRSTIICPRCTRINDRSYVVLSIKLLVMALFIGIVGWAVVTSGEDAHKPSEGKVEKIPSHVHGSDGPPDVRF